MNKTFVLHDLNYTFCRNEKYENLKIICPKGKDAKDNFREKKIISSFKQCRDEDPVLAKKPDPGLCTSNVGRFLKVF